MATCPQFGLKLTRKKAANILNTLFFANKSESYIKYDLLSTQVSNFAGLTASLPKL